MEEEQDQMPPWAQFRFRTDELEQWWDGKKRTLVRGLDIPTDAPFDEVKRRLTRAAVKRRGRARVWQQVDGSIGIVLSPASWTMDTGRGRGVG
ncbi:MAG TPA: hypothetical protein VIV15_14940 [Anaerolineales bacterium]